jgi:transcriptional regulator with XRE-family HTH domain
MDHFGARLKRAREERGVSLRRITEVTKISMSALEALERNDFSRLPGGIFSRAFVRAYAAEVGLDPEATVREFLAELSRREATRARPAVRSDITPEDIRFLERQRRAARTVRVAAVLLLVALLALVIWYLGPLGPAPDAAPAPEASARPAPIVPPPPADVLPPPPAPAKDATLHIELEATRDCWVRASADGVVAVERLFRVGERQELSADREIALEVGNAGALRWSINGRLAKTLGPLGVRRDALVTRDNFKEFWQ